MYKKNRRKQREGTTRAITKETTKKSGSSKKKKKGEINKEKQLIKTKKKERLEGNGELDYSRTDRLWCQDVDETGGKQDEKDGQTDPGQVLHYWYIRQLAVHPHASYNWWV